MPKIVSNTTPIISLLKINRLELLQKIYGEIFISKVVFNEIEAGKHKTYYQDISKINWINVLEIQDIPAIKYFLDLDSGEAEAIILSTEIKADLIILDEKLGRYYAKHADLKVTGTLGVLIKAKSAGFVEELKPLLNELISKNVWIEDKLKAKILKIVGET